MKYVALAIGLATFSTPALATPISFTGAEFASLSGISFPSGTRSIIGDSLRISATDRNFAVAALDLSQFNVNARDFEVRVNITSLLSDAGGVDQDFFVYLSDGLNLFGALFFDSANNTINVGARGDELSSDDRSLILSNTLGQSSGTPVPTNSNYLATVRVQAEAAGTTITNDIDNGTVSITAITPIVFDSNNGGPSLLFASNNANEHYLLNSVTFTRGVNTPTAVSEPGTLGGLALGLATLGLGLYRRRFA